MCFLRLPAAIYNSGVDFLRFLLTEPVQLPTTLSAYWDATRAVRDRFERPIERALCSALHADRLAHAFASGYQAALTALFPSLGRHELAALCATEAKGALDEGAGPRILMYIAMYKPCHE